MKGETFCSTSVPQGYNAIGIIFYIAMYELKGTFSCKIKVVLEDILAILIRSTNLIIWYTESAANVFIIKHLHFKREVFLHVLDDHHQNRQLDTKRQPRISWATDVVATHIWAHNLQNTGLKILIRNSSDMSILSCTNTHDSETPEVRRKSTSRKFW